MTYYRIGENESVFYKVVWDGVYFFFFREEIEERDEIVCLMGSFSIKNEKECGLI